MEEIIQEALSKGIELHVAGEYDLASQLYESVLKVQPDHADANHNMGVLKLATGHDVEALPFLQTALQANTSCTEFWLSYVRALIKLERLDEAGRILNLAKENSIESEEFVKLNQLINTAAENAVIVEPEIDTPSQSELNILDSLKLNQALRLAEKKAKEGNTEEAKRIYKDILAKFPKNKQAQEKLGAFNEPSQEIINQLINLYNLGQLHAAAEKAEEIINYYPKAFMVWNILGMANLGLGEVSEASQAFQRVTELNPSYGNGYRNLGVVLEAEQKLDDAVRAYEKALKIKPNDAELYRNMANALKDQGKLGEAIWAYEKAISIKPDYADAYSNMGITLKDQGKLEEAIEALNKALSLKPDYTVAYNNMGNVLKEQGKLEEAIESYNKALAIRPDYADAIENSLGLAVQLLPIIANFGYEFNNYETQVDSEVLLRPKYQISNAIKAYLEADFNHADSHNNNFKACDRKLLDKLTPKDKVICTAYSSFIGQLLEASWDERPDIKNKVYHLGESHCLSYAHRNIAIDGSNFRIVPRITFGAKAFHFASSKYDNSKAITKAHFVSLPKRSKVFLSYGEIDCRPNEGFIPAAIKLDKSLEELTDQTAEGYVQWFLKQNVGHKHHLYFINVPAPVYDEKLTIDLNSEVARTVALFNAALKKYSLQHGFDTVDVFKFTAGKERFSNGLFHIDNCHLGPKALPEIERQLS